jgi:antitoxin component YwqK of YwqJK toxin-antitoxin module
MQWWSTRNATVLSMVGFLLTVAPSSYAENDPEKALRRLEEDVLPKIVLLCGFPLSVKYDGDSLRKNNQDIAHDQTDGRLQCEEPLRYIWYACQTDAGKAAIKQARISKVVCKGVAGATGSLTLSAGTITVGRAFEEKKSHLRSRREFESLVKISLKLGSADPYQDEEWHKLAQLPNPVTNTKTYCLINGEKEEFNQYGDSASAHGKPDAKVKCWKDGEVVVDLEIAKGKKTGFLTRYDLKKTHRITYRDGKEHGEHKTIENGKVKSIEWYDNGQRVWQKEFFPSGVLAKYLRKFADGTDELSVHEDGKVYDLRCSPGAKDDLELRRLCGFQGAVTTSIYDGTGKVNRVQTWKDGVIQKENAGTSDYGARSEVVFKDGKKSGEERILGPAGKLASTITWDRGIKDGKEIVYADDGKKVAKEMLWKAGELKQLTEFYLNGNPKLKENYDGPKKKQSKTFWDTGRTSGEGEFVVCDNDGYRDWCEEGVHRSFFENGAQEQEMNFRRGRREGTGKSWWKNGKPASVESFADDRLTKAKRWDEDGKLVSDEEFEADGSRKIKR